MNHRLTAVFQDTQQRLWGNEQLCRLTQQAVINTKVFPENYDITRVMGDYPTGISVVRDRVLNVAGQMTEKYSRVAVINPANGVNPGGGVLSGEEDLEGEICRCSNLYPCLMKPELYEGFYGYNNGRNEYYSDRVIYSPQITVFKTDDKEPEYTSRWFQVDVLSCPAPNLNGITVPDYQKLEKVYNSRIRNMFAVAAAHGVQALVLGAFGCNEYSNSPEMMAKAFLQQLTSGEYRNYFREVVFAIPADSPGESYNYQVFLSILSPWQKNPLYGKTVSILGDSVSTYWGSNPPGYPVFYEGNQCFLAQMYSVEDTWWMKLLKGAGGRLLVNGSYSGSLVSGSGFPSGSSDQRVCALHLGGQMPDVILVTMGLYDYTHGIPVAPGYKEGMQEYEAEKYFKTAYERMLWKLRVYYPQAEIYCATLCYGTVGNRKQNPLPNGICGIPLKAYNQAIRECAWEYGCYVADLEKLQRYYSSMDGIHPDEKGMTQISRGWEHVWEQKEPEIPVMRHPFVLYGTAAGMIAATILTTVFCLI